MSSADATFAFRDSAGCQPARGARQSVVTGEEYGDVERRWIRGIPGGSRRVSRPIRISEGTLVIDIFRRQGAEPIWRGVYRDDERTGSKLTSKLPEDAKRLLAKYPKR